MFAVFGGGFGSGGSCDCKGRAHRQGAAGTGSSCVQDPRGDSAMDVEDGMYSTATTMETDVGSSAPAGHSVMVMQSGGGLAREVGAGATFSPERIGAGAGAQMETDAAATPRKGMRRSLSHSNLHDRSASIDRPSVMQCIRAIGFILEHMMREDSYRERCREYDFSGPAADMMYMGEGEEMEGVFADEVANYLHALYSLCKWTPECNIMALILIVRLFQYNPDMTLHRGNWRRLLITALMIAQKTWDDRALRNRDFPAIWASVGGGSERLSLQEVNFMEREFLRRLDHQLFIAPSMYASTYFELCSLMPSEEEIKRQLHQLIEIAGANVRVVKSAQSAQDTSFSYNTAEVMCFR